MNLHVHVYRIEQNIFYFHKEVPSRGNYLHNNTCTEGTACFLHFPRFSTTYRGMFFQSSAWYSVFSIAKRIQQEPTIHVCGGLLWKSVAEHAIQWEPTIHVCGGLSWKSVAVNTTALHGLVHSTRIFCVIVLKNKNYLI